MATITVRVDDETKLQAEMLFEDLGLTMSTAVNIFLKKCLAVNGIPFEVKRPSPNEETLRAMLESEQLIHDPNAKAYDCFDKALEDILKDKKEV